MVRAATLAACLLALAAGASAAEAAVKTFPTTGCTGGEPAEPLGLLLLSPQHSTSYRLATGMQHGRDGRTLRRAADPPPPGAVRPPCAAHRPPGLPPPPPPPPVGSLKLDYVAPRENDDPIAKCLTSVRLDLTADCKVCEWEGGHGRRGPACSGAVVQLCSLCGSSSSSLRAASAAAWAEQLRECRRA